MNRTKEKQEEREICVRLCPACAEKLEKGCGYIIMELDEPLRRCRCTLACDGHGGELALYRVVKRKQRYQRRSGGGERARAGGRER